LTALDSIQEEGVHEITHCDAKAFFARSEFVVGHRQCLQFQPKRHQCILPKSIAVPSCSLSELLEIFTIIAESFLFRLYTTFLQCAYPRTPENVTLIVYNAVGNR